MRPIIRAVLASIAVATCSLATGIALPAAAGGATAAYTVRTLHFAVAVGPDAGTHCDIIGDLYQPKGATSAHRVPAILTTNGFGGSKDDGDGVGQAFATRGYEVLSYSGLGFGGSGCKITLDDPDWDGRAASTLISFLGGASGIAFADAQHTTAVSPLNVVVHDARDHTGAARSYDPRVGMIGGSYGGEIQFAAAADDSRVDTIVPLITWNDLTYSLAPNNTGQRTGVTTRSPGTIKLTWGLLFSADGGLDGVQGGQQDPSRLYGCPNFPTFVCTALVAGATTGYFQPDQLNDFRHASVSSYLTKIKVPTLLIQGENDTLFNLNEAVATFHALRHQGTAVKMIWQSWGHSNLTPAPGEIDLADPDPATQYETHRVADWFDHYLRGSSVSTGPLFSYYRDWVHYTGIATPAYAQASAYPVGTRRAFYLSGGGASTGVLTATKAMVQTGTQALVTPPAGPPTSVDPLDVIGSFSAEVPNDTEQDVPGTAASWTSAALPGPLDVVGSPTLTVRVSAPSAAATQAAGPAGQLVLFPKLLDVGPDGEASLIKGQVAPIRVDDVTKPFRVTLPGVVHRFLAGHHLRLVLAGGATNYRGGLTPTPVTIAGGTNQVLQLPVTR